MADDALRRLAVYGTLRPGARNHGVIDDHMEGRWRRGWIEADYYEDGWRGYPGIVCRPGAPRVDVDVFESPELPQHWGRLDAFEGPGYRRRTVAVHGLGPLPVEAQVYVLGSEPGGGG